MGPVVLPETIGYISCVKNPARLAQLLRILHDSLLLCLALSLGNRGQKLFKTH
jgi:hypothetical protein